MTRDDALKFLYENGGASITEIRPALLVYYRGHKNLKPCGDDRTTDGIIQRNLRNMDATLGELELMMRRGHQWGIEEKEN